MGLYLRMMYPARQSKILIAAVKAASACPMDTAWVLTLNPLDCRVGVAQIKIGLLGVRKDVGVWIPCLFLSSESLNLSIG